MWADDPSQYQPSRDEIYRGRLGKSRNAMALLVPGLGVVFISTKHRQLSLSIATDAEIREESK